MHGMNSGIWGWNTDLFKEFQLFSNLVVLFLQLVIGVSYFTKIFVQPTAQFYNVAPEGPPIKDISCIKDLSFMMQVSFNRGKRIFCHLHKMFFPLSAANSFSVLLLSVLPVLAASSRALTCSCSAATLPLCLTRCTSSLHACNSTVD